MLTFEKDKKEIKEAIVQVENKGEANVLTGTTECGKSSVISSMAENEDVQKLLSERESSGKGSTKSAVITVTDLEAIPKDRLIMTAKMKFNRISDCSDDNDCIGKIIYSAAKEYSKNHDEKLYYSKMSKVLKLALKQPANESLEYRLKNASENDIEDLLSIMKGFSPAKITPIYNEAQAQKTKKGQQVVKKFTELMSEKKSLSPFIKQFWEYVVDFINNDMKNLKQRLIDSGVSVEDLSEEECRFTAIMGKEDIGTQLTKDLLKSEDCSKEYLFSDIQLIFRGNKDLFDVKYSEYLTVAELNGVNVHCIRFIDTQGLFHATNVTAKDESERIIDILSEWHSNKLILVVNSFITDTVKDGYAATKILLQEANRDLQVYILYTHWDEYLKSYSQQNITGKFTRATKPIDWADKYNRAIEAQNNVTNMFNESIGSNTNKKKPIIIGTYKAAILSDPDSKMENLLFEKGILYPEALNNILNDMLSEDVKNGNKHKVFENINKCFTIDTTLYSKQNIKDLYENLVVECKKPLKLYASTVRACIRKWCNMGNSHKSNVAINENGFHNIETRFVREIRNYSMNCLSKVNFDAKNSLVPSEDYDKFMADMKAYLTLDQNVGREVAKIIGEEAYENGFTLQKEIVYQYIRFVDMLEYTQDNYFSASNIDFTEKFRECLKKAIEKCINDFVDCKCIVVY